MPSTTKSKEEKVTPKVETVPDNNKKIAELEAMVQKLMAQTGQINIAPVQDLDINPNKKTKITSLTYGVLTLYCKTRGFLKFNNYGQTHSISYAQLSDYMNTCREDAEDGKFYIHDQRMVEDLGLTEIYSKLISNDIVNNIVSGVNFDFKEIVQDATEFQKQSLSDLIAEKVYNNEYQDMNGVDILSKSTGIDIMEKVREMREVEDIQKSK